MYLELSRNRYRRQRRFEGIKREISGKLLVDDTINAKVQEYTAFVTDEKKGALATYVMQRKAILDLFEQLLEYKDAEAQTYNREEAIHRLICPMQTDSTMLQITDHNMWIIDDRLPFCNFFASDKELREYSGSES